MGGSTTFERDNEGRRNDNGKHITVVTNARQNKNYRGSRQSR